MEISTKRGKKGRGRNARLNGTVAQNKTEKQTESNEQKISQKNLFTLGYGQHTEDEFVGKLKAANIKTVVDVRISPFCAYNKNFTGYNLKGILEQNGLIYEHFQELGNLFHNIDGKEKRALMYRELLENSGHLICERLLQLLNKEENTVIICACAKYLDCHRNIISSHIQEKYDINPIHL